MIILAYYNQEGKKFKAKNMQFLKCGGCSEVFHNNSIIFKKYYKNCKSIYRLTDDMFNILKDIHDPNFIELIDIYKKMNLIERFYYSKEDLFNVDAYMAKYYIEDDTNVLYESISYLLDNFRKLDILFDIFSNNAILTDDIKRPNTIINKDGIVIIDPDLFYICKDKNLKLWNKQNLLKLCRGICKKSLSNEDNYEIINANINHELTNFSVDNDTDVAYELSRKLKGYKRPIDYLSKE